MARREARSALVKLRVTEAEKEAVEVAAGAAGLSVSDYARRLLLAVPVAVGGIERAQVGVARREGSVLPGPASAPIQPPASPAEFRCPLAPGRCSFVAGSERARCPVHGRAVVAS